MSLLRGLRFDCYLAQQRRGWRCTIAIVVFLASLIFSSNANAYPNVEVIGSAGIDPPFDLGVAGTLTGFLLFTDEQMAISYGEVLKLVDMGRYALTDDQPPALSEDDDTDGRIAALAHDSIRGLILASQEDGDLLIFDLADITHKPRSITVADGDKLGPIALDQANNVAYIADSTTPGIKVVNLSTDTVTSTIALTGTPTITDALFNFETSEAYFSTSTGSLFFVSAGGTTANQITLDSLGKKNIAAMALFPTSDFIYALDSTTPSVFRVSTSAHTTSGTPISIVGNAAPTDIAIAEVSNPTATYAYVAGAGGTTGALTVINTSDDTIIDLGSDQAVDDEPLPVSATPLWLAASSRSDGNVYMGFSNGKLGIISVNPFINISSVVLDDGTSTLKENGNFTMIFKSDAGGTYELRSGGTVSANGTVLKDSNGNTSGSCTADTDVVVIVKQADNSQAFAEGVNDIWVFVTSGSTRGRRSTELTVDTPPPNVVITSIGFGANRIYVNFDRLTAADMASYNIYVDTDPDAVITKTEVAANTLQVSSGSSQTGEVGGLANDTTYYVAMEGVDAGGNKSHQRTYAFPDGSRVSGIPEMTVGPAGLSGESGCVLVEEGHSSNVWLIILVAPIIILGKFRNKALVIFFIVTGVISWANFVYAQDISEDVVAEKDISAFESGHKESSQMWSFELKTGFWLPRSNTLDAFFTKCCNLITRVQGGALFNRRYGVEGGVGFIYKSAAEVGIGTGQTAQDRFSFLLIPFETNFVWRADYFSWRYLIPYLRTGIDYVFFREGDRSRTIKGMKYGLHGGAGMQVNVGEIGDVGKSLDSDFGINDMFLTLEGNYQWINNFGGKGLDLSGGVYSIGLLFEF